MKMGFADINMQSRTGSVSSGLGSNPGGREQTLKSSPFCPRSSSKLTQSIIKDHMVSHYKKVYSAKSAIDASVPKSLLYSVKYNDQIRQEQLRKGGRPQSAQSLSQRNSRSSCSSTQSRLSVQYDDSPYLCSRSSVVSSPRFSTSFHTKEIAYPSRKMNSHPTRSASEIKYRSPETALQRKQSACSLGALVDQNSFKTFQDPVQKTYSGDLLQKHSQHFTQDKPFTPKTLKSDKSSYLSKYRYYRAPPRKQTQDCSSTGLTRQETYHGSTKNKECSQECDEPSQECNTEREWSEDEFSGTYLSSPRQQSRATKSKDHYFFDSSRFSPEGRKSPKMRSLSAEEEEIKYLEFISAVTEDILARGHISDRVIDQVIKRHIDMNRHKLNEGKMRHLLDVLRKDFEAPANLSTSTVDLEKMENGLLDSLLPHLESGEKEAKSRGESDLFPYVSLNKYCGSPNPDDPLMLFTPLCSPGRMTPTNTNEKDKKDDNEEKQISSPLLNEPSNTEASEEDFHPTDTTATNSVNNENHDSINETSDQNQVDDQFDGPSKEVEDLGRSLSESLQVSDNTHCEIVETALDPSNTTASVSDDEF